MTALPPDVTAAMASLRERWGAAAPRVMGALATAPLPSEAPERAPAPRDERIIGTGFRELDAILGPGGLPREASVAIHGSGSSGRTTLALRLAAQAQVQGAIVAWLDLARSFDPVEAVARGIRPEWLVVLTPVTLDEGLAMAGTLLGGRSVDLLVVDLPARPGPDARPARVAEQLHRLAALARRSETLLVILEPPRLVPGLAAALAAATGLRLELVRRSWIRLGRDIVGQRTEVTVARSRFGPPGRRAELRILYADGGARDACLSRTDLLEDAPTHAPATRNHQHATSPSLLAAPPPRSRPGSPDLHVVAVGTHHPRRPAVDGGDRPRRQPGGAGARRPAWDAARERPSPGPGGRVP